MVHDTIVCIERSDAIRYAAQELRTLGLQVVTKAAPDAAHVLLPVPSFPGGDRYLAHILADLPDEVVISGGNLHSELLQGYQTVDFLKDPYYLAENAAITASAAIGIVEERLGGSLAGFPVLVIGWGRIGKCLSKLLAEAGANVTVAARKDSDRAMIRALGSHSISITDAANQLLHYRAIINTAPEMILPNIVTQPDCVVLELASQPGMSGPNIIDGRGLPGKLAPKASGRLIARTFIRLSLGKEQ